MFVIQKKTKIYFPIQSIYSKPKFNCEGKVYKNPGACRGFYFTLSTNSFRARMSLFQVSLRVETVYDFISTLLSCISHSQQIIESINV